jgi:hypothetical protein
MRSSAWHSGQRGYLTLIALLVVIVIIGILFATQYGGSPRRTGPTPRGESQTLLGGAVDRANPAPSYFGVYIIGDVDWGVARSPGSRKAG